MTTEASAALLDEAAEIEAYVAANSELLANALTACLTAAAVCLVSLMAVVIAIV